MGSKGGLSLIFGAIVGTITALLFAPGKGKELRSKMKNEFKKSGPGVKSLGDDLKKMWGDMKGSFDEFVKDEEVQDVIKKGKKVLEKAKEKGNEIVTDISNEMKDNVKDLKPKAKKAIKKASAKVNEIKEDIKKMNQPVKAEKSVKKVVKKKMPQKAVVKKNAVVAKGKK